jgi:hypothetical protein
VAALLDPLADLKAEIAAEEAAEAAKTAAPAAEEPPAETEEEPEVEAKPEAKAEPEAKTEPAKPAAAKPATEEKPKPKPASERMVPAERMNEYAVKNRQLERRLETLAEELERLRNPPKQEAEKPPQTADQIRAEAIAQAKLEITVDAFVAEGNSAFGEAEFGAACQRIQDLIGKKNNLVTIAVAALDTPAAAARALGRLGQKDAPEIEAFLKMPEAKMGRLLEKYANEKAPKAPKAEGGEREPAPRRARIEQEEEPPEPIRPINGGNRVAEGFEDEVPDDVWFKRFDEQILNKPRSH